MPVRRSTLVTAAVAALFAALVLAAPASAGYTSYKTTLTLNSNYPAFKGKVKSSYKFCTQERRVKLFRERGGHRVLLGTTTSSASNGSWAIPIGNRLTSGSYYATVTAKTSAEIGVRCQAAKSRVAVAD
jgi:hypothetical protein